MQVKSGAKLTARQQKIYHQYLEKEKGKGVERAQTDIGNVDEGGEQPKSKAQVEMEVKREAMSDRERRLDDLCGAFDVHIDKSAGSWTVQPDSISMRGVNVRLRSNGAQLLQDAHLKIVAGHRYSRTKQHRCHGSWRV